MPVRDLTVTLRGYLAVRLLFERAALDEAARRFAFAGPLSDFRRWLRIQFRAPPAPRAIDRAWPLLHVAQLCGRAETMLRFVFDRAHQERFHLI